MSILLSHGAADSTAFALAIIEEEGDVVQVFLDRGADINGLHSMYGRNRTPLMWAVMSPASLAMATLLIENGADPRLKSGTESPLTYAERNA